MYFWSFFLFIQLQYHAVSLISRQSFRKYAMFTEIKHGQYTCASEWYEFERYFSMLHVPHKTGNKNKVHEQCLITMAYITGNCTCTSGFAGSDCSFDTTGPPTITGTSYNICDKNKQDCDALYFYGGYFLENMGAMCYIRKSEVLHLDYFQIQ